MSEPLVRHLSNIRYRTARIARTVDSIVAAHFPNWHRRRKFARIFRQNFWGDPHSASGSGSNLEQTATIRREIPLLLRRHDVRSLIDAPCGDLFWMQHVALDVQRYIGIDIVPSVIARNQARYANHQRQFMTADIVQGRLPAVDLIFCRDCLVHLSRSDIRKAVENFRRSGATWLLTTTFTGKHDNRDITTGEWRQLNLQLPPFNFPAPIDLVIEECTEYGGIAADKSLGLWRLADLRINW